MPVYYEGAPGGHHWRGEPKGWHLKRGKGNPGGEGRKSAPGGGLHVFLEGEVVVGEVGVEVEFTEVYFFVIGGGVV